MEYFIRVRPNTKFTVAIDVWIVHWSCLIGGKRNLAREGPSHVLGARFSIIEPAGPELRSLMVSDVLDDS